MTIPNLIPLLQKKLPLPQLFTPLPQKQPTAQQNIDQPTQPKTASNCLIR